jgi:hypothetical protein
MQLTQVSPAMTWATSSLGHTLLTFMAARLNYHDTTYTA